jgi:hypothetical protein
MKKDILVRVGTGRTIHKGYKYEGEKQVYVSCGAVRHSGGQRLETFSKGEVTCKKCLKATEEVIKEEVKEMTEQEFRIAKLKEYAEAKAKDEAEQMKGLKEIYEEQRRRRA